jgi:ElaB/YqjD/DUF883 family membrane-anchored ribosome-binding protein
MKNSLNNTAIESGKAALRGVKALLSSTTAEVTDNIAHSMRDAGKKLRADGDRLVHAANDVTEQTSGAVSSGLEITKTLTNGAVSHTRSIAGRTTVAGLALAAIVQKYVRTNPALTLLLGTVGGIALGRLLAFTRKPAPKARRVPARRAVGR